MKWVCIKDGDWNATNYSAYPNGFGPKEGDVVQVIDSYTDEGKTFLVLKGWEVFHGIRCGFHSIWFRPIDYSFGEKIATEITEQVEKTFKEETIEV